MVGYPHAIRNRNRIGYMVSDSDEVMNKYEEALDKIKELYVFRKFGSMEEVKSDYKKECDLLEELVKRATPMKPTIHSTEEYVKHSCPVCGISGMFNYCPVCGQAIDWSNK